MAIPSYPSKGVGDFLVAGLMKTWFYNGFGRRCVKIEHEHREQAEHVNKPIIRKKCSATKVRC